MEEKKKGFIKGFLKISGMVVLGLALYFVFLYTLLPYDKIKDFILAQVNPSLQPYQLEIGEVRLTLPAGLGASDVTILNKTAESEIAAVALETLKASVKPLALIKKTLALSFSGDCYEGSISGNVAKGTERVACHVEMDKIRLNGHPQINAWLPSAELTSAIVSGTLDLDFEEKNFAGADGYAELNVEKFILEHPSFFALTFPAVNLDTIQGRVNLESGKGTLEDISLKGQDLEIQIDGNFSLSRIITYSSMKLEIAFKLSGEFDKQYGSMLSMFKKKDEDGYYRVSIMGTFANPRVNYM